MSSKDPQLEKTNDVFVMSEEATQKGSLVVKPAHHQRLMSTMQLTPSLNHLKTNELQQQHLKICIVETLIAWR